jgi:hypothetical protein
MSVDLLVFFSAVNMKVQASSATMGMVTIHGDAREPGRRDISPSLNKDMSPLICIHRLSTLHLGQGLGSRVIFDWA